VQSVTIHDLTKSLSLHIKETLKLQVLKVASWKIVRVAKLLENLRVHGVWSVHRSI
jgi:hypothetical protein